MPDSMSPELDSSTQHPKSSSSLDFRVGVFDLRARFRGCHEAAGRAGLTPVGKPAPSCTAIRFKGSRALGFRVLGFSGRGL